MKFSLLQNLACPACKGSLELQVIKEEADEIESGLLFCLPCRSRYPIIKYIPRFVPIENYADNFGFQWQKFHKTQLDSYNGLTISRDRLLESSGWTPDNFSDKVVLDVGCGAGRFAEVALSCGAELVALDYSLSVDACWQNLGPHPRLNLVQGDIYNLPFLPGCFDLVYCLGVLQHTPDVQAAFCYLVSQLKSGGRLVVDVYSKTYLTLLWPKYWLRPFTRRMPQQKLFNLVQFMVKYLLPLSLAIGRIPKIGRKLRYALPVMNYEPDFPLSAEQLKEWAILDTFDMLSPRYDNPQTEQTLERWFKGVGLQNIRIFRRGVVVGRGEKV